jgi:hypothetical protein
MFGRGVASEALTDLLGIDAEELRTQLRAGATLAEIATEPRASRCRRSSTSSSPR